MVSANHMLIVFLGIEMASVPSYALVAVTKDRRLSAEAALKFAVFGGGAAGVMLYGISLLVGTPGNGPSPDHERAIGRLTEFSGWGRIPTRAGSGRSDDHGRFRLQALGRSVPLLGRPDAFEGATAEVAAFLSIASKAAALALLLRVVLGLGHVPSTMETAAPIGYSQVGAAEIAILSDMVVPEIDSSDLEPVRQYSAWLIAIFAAVTCTFGNLAAYGQNNMKRLLAYSTIAHAGYMLMPVSAAILLAGSDPAAARETVASIGFYIAIYLLMNLGAFAIVAFLRNELDSEQLPDYAGLAHRSPALVVCTAIIMFSLVGLPPLAGFAGKFAIFAQTYRAGLLSLVVIGVINTVFSLFYYLRVVKTMTIDPEPEGRPAPSIRFWSNPGFYCALIAFLLVALGIFWNRLFVEAQIAASMLLP